MNLGVCYYPEHWPPERWPIDATLMRKAGLKIVRIGEFAWAQIEPVDGQFNWDWLDQVIRILAAEDLCVVLGTPTAAPPSWLVKIHPDVPPVDVQGRQRRFATRRHYCPNNPNVKRHAGRIVKAMAKRYGSNNTVIGWQIDNEFGSHETARCYCSKCTAAFQGWLKERYKSIEELNLAWGTSFWNQTYFGWDEIDPPNLTVAKPNPSHVLDYYRFSSASVRAFVLLQVDILRKYAIGQFVTTNFMGDFPDLDYHQLAQPLDFASWSSYPTGYSEVRGPFLYGNEENPPTFAYDIGDPYITGFCHDLTRGLKQKPFWVMEQQCGQINWSYYNTGVRPGNVRFWTWHALASGAESVIYFRWRAGLSGLEQHHSGLLKHDGSLDIGYKELIAMLPERAEMDKTNQTQQSAEVAILLDYENLWAIQIQPHHKNFGYMRHMFIYYRALQQLGITTDIISPESDLSSYKIVIAHTLWMGTKPLAKKIKKYTEDGGIIIFGVRSGFKTSTNLVTQDPLPGPFRELVGVTVSDWHALPPGLDFQVESIIPGLSGPLTLWAESLLPCPVEGKRQKLSVLAHYSSDPFSSETALTENQIGKGFAYYLGWYPTVQQAKSLLLYVASKSEIDYMDDLPTGLIPIQRGLNYYLFNFNDYPIEVTIQGNTTNIKKRDVSIISNSLYGT